MQNEEIKQILGTFSQVSGTLMNPSLEALKKAGGRIMGYTCSVVPEEIMIAAGLMPFRLRGSMSDGTDLADQYFTSWNCSFPRHCFNLALQGQYDFLDGLVVAGTCDTMRYVYDNWKKGPLNTPLLFQLNMPHVSGKVMSSYFRDELAGFRSWLQTAFSVSLTDDRIWEAIRLCNRTRSLQQALYGLRKSNCPPITASDIVSVMVAGVSLPKEAYNADLAKLLNALQDQPVEQQHYRARILLIGSGGDDRIITSMAENLGATVVSDHTCFGGKLNYQTIPETSQDPLQAIADYHILTRPFCPKIGGAYEIRKQVVLDLIREYRIDGFIGQRMGCCDCWSGELFSLREDLKAEGIPGLILEREYIPDSEGQMETRIQAFIETLTN
ncbi:MAG: 2-hydroxyacyl-CoA dehydratase family protein [Bacteroidales bacterium]|nr:2-hydroxyacyl-CoA dehydratase family protein [Bacteroidales bacterium]